MVVATHVVTPMTVIRRFAQSVVQIIPVVMTDLSFHLYQSSKHQHQHLTQSAVVVDGHAVTLMTVMHRARYAAQITPVAMKRFAATHAKTLMTVLHRARHAAQIAAQIKPVARSRLGLLCFKNAQSSKI